MKKKTERGSRGPAPNWNLGRTKTIRVPIAIADQLLKIARKIDRGEPIEPQMLKAPINYTENKFIEELSKDQ
ncbi:MAG: hypothetical protein F6K14_02465 [Symploca sp. SIO2C1]|nr:hypothetical protein [Symploca sp. SIO2C1]